MERIQAREDKEKISAHRHREQKSRKVICLCLNSAGKAKQTKSPPENANPDILSSLSDITTWSKKLQAEN